jgi:hypothetical protein
MRTPAMLCEISPFCTFVSAPWSHASNFKAAFMLMHAQDMYYQLCLIWSPVGAHGAISLHTGTLCFQVLRFQKYVP